MPPAGTALFDLREHHETRTEEEIVSRRLLSAMSHRRLPITKATVRGVLALVRAWEPTDPTNAPEACAVLGCDHDTAAPGKRWCREHALATQDLRAAA